MDHTERFNSETRLLTPGVGWMRGLVVLTITVFCALLLVWLFCPAVIGPHRTPYRYLVPAGYIGPVQLDYGVAGAPSLQLVEGHYEIRFNGDGKASVSSPDPNDVGWAKDEWWWESPDGQRTAVPQSLVQGAVQGSESAAWGKIGKPSSMRSYFKAFVGDESQFTVYMRRIRGPESDR